MSETTNYNNQLVLVSGGSATGKSASLRDIAEQARWFYFNCEAGKRLPFKNKFRSATVTDPYQVWSGFDYMMQNPDLVDGAIIDTITFLMEMFEAVHVRNSPNTQQAWGDYGAFFRTLMQQKIAAFGKPVIVMGHTLPVYNEKTMSFDVSVPVKGALKGQGVEAFFSTVVSAKKMTLKDLEPYIGENNPLLTVTEDDQILGYKHVFQTRLTKDTVGERIRSPMGMFSREETFMDNNCHLLLHRLREFYATDNNE